MNLSFYWNDLAKCLINYHLYCTNKSLTLCLWLLSSSNLSFWNKRNTAFLLCCEDFKNQKENNIVDCRCKISPLMLENISLACCPHSWNNFFQRNFISPCNHVTCSKPKTTKEILKKRVLHSGKLTEELFMSMLMLTCICFSLLVNLFQEKPAMSFLSYDAFWKKQQIWSILQVIRCILISISVSKCPVSHIDVKLLQCLILVMRNTESKGHELSSLW